QRGYQAVATLPQTGITVEKSSPHRESMTQMVWQLMLCEQLSSWSTSSAGMIRIRCTGLRSSALSADVGSPGVRYSTIASSHNTVKPSTQPSSGSGPTSFNVLARDQTV